MEDDPSLIFFIFANIFFCILLIVVVSFGTNSKKNKECTSNKYYNLNKYNTYNFSCPSFLKRPQQQMIIQQRPKCMQGPQCQKSQQGSIGPLAPLGPLGPYQISKQMPNQGCSISAKGSIPNFEESNLVPKKPNAPSILPLSDTNKYMINPSAVSVIGPNNVSSCSSCSAKVNNGYNQGNSKVGSCSSKCSGIDPVSDPKYNMQQIVKQSILLEEHLANKTKRCRDCITKHFLHIIGLAEEAQMLATNNIDKYPLINECVIVYNTAFQQWIKNYDYRANETCLNCCDTLRTMRKRLIAVYFFNEEYSIQ